MNQSINKNLPGKASYFSETKQNFCKEAAFSICITFATCGIIILSLNRSESRFAIAKDTEVESNAAINLTGGTR